MNHKTTPPFFKRLSHALKGDFTPILFTLPFLVLLVYLNFFGNFIFPTPFAWEIAENEQLAKDVLFSFEEFDFSPHAMGFPFQAVIYFRPPIGLLVIRENSFLFDLAINLLLILFFLFLMKKITRV